MSKKQIILNTSDEAATFRTDISGWVSKRKRIIKKWRKVRANHRPMRHCIIANGTLMYHPSNQEAVKVIAQIRVEERGMREPNAVMGWNPIMFSTPFKA